MLGHALPGLAGSPGTPQLPGKENLHLKRLATGPSLGKRMLGEHLRNAKKTPTTAGRAERAD